MAQAVDLHCGSQFQQELQSLASVYWTDVPLRDGLNSLSRARRVAVWLDRRVVPRQPVSLSLHEIPLRTCLFMLAEQQDLDVSWVDCIVYIGPSRAADRFATVNSVHRQLLAKLPRKTRQTWQNQQAMRWFKLAVPRDLVSMIEKEVGVKISGQAQIAHDLWPSGNLPPLPAYTRLGLLLAGFDLTFLWNDDGSVRVVPMPERPKLRKSYRGVSKQKMKVIRALIAEYGTATLDESGGRFKLFASWRVHEAVHAALDESRPRDNQTANVRYSLRGEAQPVGPLVEKLAKQFELECLFSEAARGKYLQRVSFAVKQVKRDELFRAILDQAELKYELRGNVLRVLAQ